MCAGNVGAHIASMMAQLADAAKCFANNIKECHTHAPKLTISRRGVIKPVHGNKGTPTRGRGRGGAKKRKSSPKRCAPSKDDAGPSFRYDKGDEEEGGGRDFVFCGTSYKLGGMATGMSRLVA